MKKVLCVLLAICMLIPLAVTPAFAAVQSAEEFEQLRQKAEGGDASAMEEVANVYYRGNYKSGVSRDFSQALDWFLRAADAGNTNVYVTIATIYEKGSAGVRDLEKAYEWYQRAAENGSQEALEATQKEIFQGGQTQNGQTQGGQGNNDVYNLTGTLGEFGTLGGRSGTPFYLDRPVIDCPRIVLQLAIIEYRGWPFGLYGLYAMNMSGSWVELSRFQIEKSQAGEGAEPRTYTFDLSSPQSFKALAVVLLEDGMDFDLVHADSFIVDRQYVSEYTATVPAPAFVASGMEYPKNSASFSMGAWVNPYPIG